LKYEFEVIVHVVGIFSIGAIEVVMIAPQWTLWRWLERGVNGIRHERWYDSFNVWKAFVAEFKE